LNLSAELLGGSGRSWIGPGAPGAQTRLFRRTFLLEDADARATLRIFAESRYHVWINGAYLGRGPCFHHPTELLVDSYAVDTVGQLRPGKNAIAVLVHAPDVSMHNHVRTDEPGLNTAVIGAPGCVLPMDNAQAGMSPARLNHRKAITLWHGRNTRWRPLWRNSDKGRLGSEPTPSCFARIEHLGGEDRVTAVALRPSAASVDVHGVSEWQGRWAIIAQDDADIRSSRRLACIGFDGGWIELDLARAQGRVLALTRAGERRAHEASITGGRVRIEASSTDANDVLGYLIEAGEA
jgi:hypothetical protein